MHSFDFHSRNQNQDPRNNQAAIELGQDSPSDEFSHSTKGNDESEPTSKEGSNPRDDDSNPMVGSNEDRSGNNSGNNASASKYVHHPNHPNTNQSLPPESNEPPPPSHQDQGSKDKNHQGHQMATGDGSSSDGNNVDSNDPPAPDMRKEAKASPPVVSKPIAIVGGKGANSGEGAKGAKGANSGDDAAIKSEDTNVLLTMPQAANQPNFLPMAPSLLRTSGGLTPPVAGSESNAFSAAGLGMYHQLMMHYAKRGGALAQMQQAAFSQQLQWQQQMMLLAANAGAQTMSQTMSQTGLTLPKSEDQGSPLMMAGGGNAGTVSQAEARALALERYRQKRRSLKFGKIIRYESRKQLAQSRTRVKGKFSSLVKNAQGRWGPHAQGGADEGEEEEEEEEDEEEDREENGEQGVKKMRVGCEGQNFISNGFAQGCSKGQNEMMQCGEEGNRDGGGSGTNADPGAGEGMMIPAQSGSGRKRRHSGRSGSRLNTGNNLQLSGNVEEEDDVVNSLMKLRQLAGSGQGQGQGQGEGEGEEDGKRAEGGKGKSGSDCSGSNSPNSDENASGDGDRSGQGSGGDE